MTQEVALKVAMACEVSELADSQGCCLGGVFLWSSMHWKVWLSSCSRQIAQHDKRGTSGPWYPFRKPLKCTHLVLLQGCSGAVQRVLNKMEGVQSVDIDMAQQKVVVKGNVEPQKVLETVAKTGKATSFWQ